MSQKEEKAKEEIKGPCQVDFQFDADGNLITKVDGDCSKLLEDLTAKEQNLHKQYEEKRLEVQSKGMNATLQDANDLEELGLRLKDACIFRTLLIEFKATGKWDLGPITTKLKK